MPLTSLIQTKLNEWKIHKTQNHSCVHEMFYCCQYSKYSYTDPPPYIASYSLLRRILCITI